MSASRWLNIEMRLMKTQLTDSQIAIEDGEGGSLSDLITGDFTSLTRCDGSVWQSHIGSCPPLRQIRDEIQA